jgi:antitoxin (DNA-binding transcriptional repressor) of toxin-antitoxin stability system
MRQVSVRDIGAAFEQNLADVEAGETVEIVRDGKPVARLSPASSPRRPTPASRDPEAWNELLAIMDRGLSPGRIEPWTRDELYEERLWRFFP